jgi:hypothetical protein
VEHFERQIVAWLGVLLGAWFLARAAQSKREKLAMKELLGVQVDKVKVFRNFFIQRLEAIIGFSFVLFGVATHIYVLVRQTQAAQSAYDPPEALRHMVQYIGFAVVVLVLVTALMHAVCSWFSKRIFLDLLGYLMVRYDYRLEDDTALLMQIGEILGVDRGEDDTVESYTRRIETALKLEEIEAHLLERGKLPRRTTRRASRTAEPL